MIYLALLIGCETATYYGGGTVTITFEEAEGVTEWEGFDPPEGSLTIEGVSRPLMDARDERGDVCEDGTDCVYGAWYQLADWNKNDHYEIRGWTSITEETSMLGAKERCGRAPSALRLSLVEFDGVFITWEGSDSLEPMLAFSEDDLSVGAFQREAGAIDMSYSWNHGCGGESEAVTYDGLRIEWNFEFFETE